jgi:predicted dehydrogenase
MDGTQRGTLGADGDGRSLRIGIVGLGYWGPNLVRNLAEAPAFDISYLCDLRPQPL